MKPDRTTKRKGRPSRRKNDHLNEEAILMQSALKASSKAFRSSKALGLTVQVIKNGDIISITPDDKRTVLRSIAKSKNTLPGLKKGMILNKK